MKSSKLEQLRHEIDQIDDQLMTFLNRRAALVRQVKEAKARESIDIYSVERERQILERVNRSLTDFPKSAGEQIFRTILSASRSLIGELFIAHLGAECAPAYDAAKQQFGDDAKMLSFGSTHEVVHAVEREHAHYGVLPLELLGQGVNEETILALMQSSLRVIATIELPQQLVLCSHGDALYELKQVFGELSAFQGAEQWLSSNISQAERTVVESSNVALQRATKSKHLAALLPERVARDSKLHVVARGIERGVGGIARFIVVGRTASPITGRDKTCLVCTAQERTGALYEMLRPFADHGVTLSKIESKRVEELDNEHLFYIELVGHAEMPEVQSALRVLNGLSKAFKVLGSYPYLEHEKWHQDVIK